MARKPKPSAEEAAAAAAASDQPNDLTAIIAEGMKLIDILRDIALTENELSVLSKEKNAILGEKLPELMAVAGFGTGDKIDVEGFAFTLSEYVSGSWPKDPAKRALAKRRLKEYDGLGLLQTQISLAFAKGEEKIATAAAKALKKFGDPTVEETVHHSSLAAFARERLEKGETIDFEALGLRSAMLVRVRVKKKRKTK